jgi:transcription initiation factor TFIIH subunit 1
MSEVEFWTKYCRAELIHRTHIQAAVAAEAEADEQLAIFLKDDDIIANESKKRVSQMFS